MINLVKLDSGILNLRVVHDDEYLVSLENHIINHGITMPIFLTHCVVVGEYDVLAQCDVIQALLNLYSKWLKNKDDVVPKGVYVKDHSDWYIEVVAGIWQSSGNIPYKPAINPQNDSMYKKACYHD